jgi:putative ABC transport system permease protein
MSADLDLSPALRLPARSQPGGRDRLLPLRLAVRELRGGLRGFRVFLACLAIGVMAIAAVGSVAESLVDGLAREGRTILGGDVAFALAHREASPEERTLLESGGDVSAAATMRAMARNPEGAALVELKAVDARYPLYGKAVLEPAGDLEDALAPRDGIYGAVADEALFARLALNPGGRIGLGDVQVEIRAVLRGEPDRLAGGIGFGPRLLISQDALRATGLLQPGSLVRWHYRLKLPGSNPSDRAVEAFVETASKSRPDAGWNIRTRQNASPQLERNIERFTQFLTLVGLTALLVGGVGVANAVKAHLDRKRAVIATLKSLGATGGRVFALYLTQIMLLACLGSALGLAVGAVAPYLIAWGLGAIIPVPIEPTLKPAQLALALLYGLVTAFAFALWPLGRAHDLPAAALFRDEVAPERNRPRRRYVVATAVAVVLLAVLAIALAYDRRIAQIFVGSAALVFVGLRLIATLLMALARRVPRSRSTVIRLAVTNIHRPGALTPTVVLSLGLGLAVLVTVTLIEGNLRHQITAALPERAPSFFFIDLPGTEGARFDTFVRGQAPAANLERVPMLRGRIVAAKGIKAEELRPTANAGWVLENDRGITYASVVPQGSRVVAGEWWSADETAALVSLEKRIADGLGLKLGDELTVNVLGRNVSARIANLRTVDWQNLGINFVLVFSPATFRGAPHTDLATLTYPNGSSTAEEVALLKAVAQAFPGVTTVRVKDALDSVGSLLSKLALGIRAASLITILSAVLVLGGALAAGHRHRVYDAVVLKTLGATRARLIAAYALEYLMLGLATGVFGVAAGSLAAALIVTEVMNFRFTWLPGPALLSAGAALGLTLLLGLAGTITALGQKPAPVLRNL